MHDKGRNIEGDDRERDKGFWADDMIKAVIFDIDGVLVDSKEHNVSFFQSLMQAAGYPKPGRRKILEAFHMTMLGSIQHFLKDATEEEVQRIWKLGHTFPRPKYLQKVNPYAHEAIEALSKKYKLGIVTSRIMVGLDGFYKMSGMKRYFSAAVSFEDYSNPKPHPEPIMVALKRLGTKPKEAVYVGDTETDMKAAKAAGIEFILYSKKPLKGAKFRTSSFKKLIKIINKID